MDLFISFLFVLQGVVTQSGAIRLVMTAPVKLLRWAPMQFRACR